MTNADEARIHKAVEIRTLAELELVSACLDAMRHGASISQTAAASGKSERTIIRWRQGQGLPTFDDWHMSSRERQARLYEALPWLRETQQMLRDLKGENSGDES
jgi:hypothetical protein